MARLPDIPVSAWIADQQELFARSIAGKFEDTEAQAVLTQRASEIPYDPNEARYGDDLKAIADLEERQRQADEEERRRREEQARQLAYEQQLQASDDQRQQEARQAQAAEEARQAALRTGAQEIASGYGIPSPSEFGDMASGWVGTKPGTGNNSSTTGAFDSSDLDTPSFRPQQQPVPPAQTTDPLPDYDQGRHESWRGPYAGTARPILNPDGSQTTERSITIDDPDLNGGRPTNIPTVWGSQVVSDDEATDNAVRSGLTFPSYGSIDEAEQAAQRRSEDLGAGRATSIGGARLGDYQSVRYGGPAPSPDDPPVSYPAPDRPDPAPLGSRIGDAFESAYESGRRAADLTPAGHGAYQIADAALTQIPGTRFFDRAVQSSSDAAVKRFDDQLQRTRADRIQSQAQAQTSSLTAEAHDLLSQTQDPQEQQAITDRYTAEIDRVERQAAQDAAEARQSELRRQAEMAESGTRASQDYRTADRVWDTVGRAEIPGTGGPGYSGQGRSNVAQVTGLGSNAPEGSAQNDVGRFYEAERNTLARGVTDIMGEGQLGDESADDRRFMERAAARYGRFQDMPPEVQDAYTEALQRTQAVMAQGNRYASERAPGTQQFRSAVDAVAGVASMPLMPGLGEAAGVLRTGTAAERAAMATRVAGGIAVDPAGALMQGAIEGPIGLAHGAGALARHPALEPFETARRDFAQGFKRADTAVNDALGRGYRAVDRRLQQGLGMLPADDIGPTRGIVPLEAADELDFPLRIPTDERVLSAIRRIGGQIDPRRGVSFFVTRAQSPSGADQIATRGMPFYEAVPQNWRGWSEYTGADDPTSVGGSERIPPTRTRFRNPLIVEGQPGEPKAFNSAIKQLGVDVPGPGIDQQELARAQVAYTTAKTHHDAIVAQFQVAQDALARAQREGSPDMGDAWVEVQRLNKAYDSSSIIETDAYDALVAIQRRADESTPYNVIKQEIHDARRSGGQASPERQAALEQIVAKYGGDPSVIGELLKIRGADSPESAWAIFENILATNARRQKHDGIIAIEHTGPAYGSELDAHPVVAQAKATLAQRAEELDQAYKERERTLQGLLPEGIRHRPGDETRDQWINRLAQLQFTDPSAHQAVDTARRAALEHPDYQAIQQTLDDRAVIEQQARAGLRQARENVQEDLGEYRIKELGDVRESRNPVPGEPSYEWDVAIKELTKARAQQAELKAREDALVAEWRAAHDNSDRPLFRVRRSVAAANPDLQEQMILADRAVVDAQDGIDTLREEGIPQFGSQGGYTVRADVRRRDPTWQRARRRQRAAEAHNDEMVAWDQDLREREQRGENVAEGRQDYQDVQPDVAREYQRANQEVADLEETGYPEYQGLGELRGAEAPAGWDVAETSVPSTEARRLGAKSLPSRTVVGAVAGGLAGTQVGDENDSPGQNLADVAAGAVAGAATTRFGTQAAGRLVDHLITRGALSSDVLLSHAASPDRIRALFALAAQNLPDDAPVQIPGMVGFLTHHSPEARAAVSELISGPRTAGEIREILARTADPGALGRSARDLIVDLLAGVGGRASRGAESAADRATIRGLGRAPIGPGEAVTQAPLGARLAAGALGVAREIPAEHPVVGRIHRIADQLGIARPRVFFTDSPEVNAAATIGRGNRGPSMVLTRGLMTAGLGDAELDALVTHELAHTTEESFGQALMGRVREVAGGVRDALSETREAVRAPRRGVWRQRVEAGAQIPERATPEQAKEIQAAYDLSMRHLEASQNPKLKAKNQIRWVSQAHDAWAEYERLVEDAGGTRESATGVLPERAPATVPPVAGEAPRVDPATVPQRETEASLPDRVGEPRVPDVVEPEAGPGPVVAASEAVSPRSDLGSDRDAPTPSRPEDLTIGQIQEPVFEREQWDPKARIPHDEAARVIRALREETALDPQAQAIVDRKGAELLAMPKPRNRHIEQLVEMVGQRRATAREGAQAWADRFLERQGYLTARGRAPVEAGEAGAEAAGQAAEAAVAASDVRLENANGGPPLAQRSETPPTGRRTRFDERLVTAADTSWLGRARPGQTVSTSNFFGSDASWDSRTMESAIEAARRDGHRVERFTYEDGNEGLRYVGREAPERATTRGVRAPTGEPSDEEIRALEQEFGGSPNPDIPDEVPTEDIGPVREALGRTVDPSLDPPSARNDPRFQSRGQATAPTRVVNPTLVERAWAHWAPKLTDQYARLQGYQNDIAREMLKTGSRMLPEQMAAELKRLDPNRAAEMDADTYLKPALRTFRKLGYSDANINTYLSYRHDIDITEKMLADAQQLPPAQRQQAIQAAMDRKFPDGTTYDQARTYVDEWEARKSQLPQGQAWAVDAALRNVWDLGDRILQIKRDAGLIDDASYQAMRDAYPHYLPTKILDYINDDGHVATGKSLSVNSSTIHKLSAAGTERTALDALPALYGALYEAHAAANKNRVFNAFTEMWEAAKALDAAHAPGAVLNRNQQRIRDFSQFIHEADVPGAPNRPKDEFTTVSGFKDGVKTKLAVHNDLGDVTRYDAPITIPLVSGLTAAFKMGATSRNPIFLTANMLLDLNNFVIRETARAGGPQHFPDVLKVYGQTLGELLPLSSSAGALAGGGAGMATINEDDPIQVRAAKVVGGMFAGGLVGHGIERLGGPGAGAWGEIARHEYSGAAKRYLEQGGGMAGVTGGGELRPKAFGWRMGQLDVDEALKRFGMYDQSELEKGLSRLGRDFFEVNKPADLLRFADVTKPVEALGERIELVPRVAAMKLAERRGAGATEATIAGRTTTIDFAKGGVWTKTLNQIVPFFNVGVQSGVDIQRAFSEAPTAFTATIATGLVVPMIAAESWNQGDPQRKADYDDVPDYIKDQGLVLMLPGQAPVDSRGNRRPQFIHIRYRQFAPLAVLTRETMQRWYFDRASSEDKRTALEATAAGVAQVLPISASDPADLASNMLPPPVGTVLQVAPGVNKDFFRGQRIRSEFADERASPLSHAISEYGRNIPGIGPNMLDTPAAAEFTTRDIGSGVAGMLHGASEILAGKRQEDPNLQNIPVAGGLIGRFVKGSIGQKAEFAREHTLTPSADKILRDAGVRWRPSASDPEILDVPLSRQEYASYQKEVNKATDQAIQRMGRDKDWQKMSPDDKQDVVTSIIDEERGKIRKAAFARIPDKEIDKRLAQIEKEKKAKEAQLKR